MVRNLKEDKLLTRKTKMKLSVPLAVALAVGSVEANAGIILGADLAELTVFSNTYTTTGDSAIIHGSVLVGTIATTGANAAVNGDVTSVGAANIGGGTATVANVAGSGAVVTGSVISNGVLTVGGATTLGPIGPRISGSIISTGASTIGAFSEVGGDMLSGGVATTGANSKIGTGINGGSLSATGAATVGAKSTVYGALLAGGVITVSADGGSVVSSGILTTPVDLSAVRTDVFSEAQQVKDAQDTLFDMGLGTKLAAVIGNTTLVAGIYSAESLSTTASTTITLQGDGSADQSWIFNIRDILAFGASTNIVMDKVGANASVYWNSYGTLDTEGYISTGASSKVIGTLLANTYVSVGAGAKVMDIGTSCGAVYSATSYVSTGAGAVIGGNGCAAVSTQPTPPVTSLPEPESFGMLLAALALFGFKRSRKA
jgi:hypothetical protein